MTTGKRPRPGFYCVKCRHPRGGILGDTVTCDRPAAYGEASGRCGGQFSSALNLTDWKECPTCRASGKDGGEECGQCEGWGWLLQRTVP